MAKEEKKEVLGVVQSDNKEQTQPVATAVESNTEQKKVDTPVKKSNAKKKVKKTTKKKTIAKAERGDEETDEKEHHFVEEAIMEKEASGIPKELLIGAFIVVIVLGAIFLSMSGPSEPADGSTSTTIVNQVANDNGIAEDGELVRADYVGRLKNGTVFDTSMEALAKEEGIYNNVRQYQPIEFILGQGGLIQGFETYIRGMKIGEEKEFELTPDKAYGMLNPSLIQVIPKVQKSPATQNVSREKFVAEIGKEPVVGEQFNIPKTDDVAIDWPLKVLNVYEDIVTFKYIPGEKQEINTVFGLAEVSGEDDMIVIKVNSEVGDEILTLTGPAKVTEVNEENITLDFNHPLAGQTLKFWVKILDVSAP